MIEHFSKYIGKIPNKKVAILVDFLPLVIFFIVYRIAGFANSTLWLVISSISVMLGVFLVYRVIPLMTLISTMLLTFFGLLGYFLDDIRFVQFKVTLLYLLLAGVFIGSILFKKYPTRYMMGGSVEMMDKKWRNLDISWAIFFIFLATLNEFAVRFFSESAWVSFKVFGLLIITVVFLMLQVPYIMKYGSFEK